YDLDNTNPKVQALGQGATATDTITVYSADGTPHQVTIIVNGTNDSAVIAGTDSGSVEEKSQLQASGTLSVTDVDTGEAHFSNTDIVGLFGTLHLQNNGAWTYDLDNTNPKVQALSQGVIATDTMIVHSADGTPHQVTITVNGTNDSAVIAGTDSGSVTEESQLQASGTLTVTDVDTGESHFSNTDVVGLFGTLHLKEDGNWRYDLDNTNPKVQALAQGATATDTITVNSADGTPHQVTITVNGTNDTAVITGTDSGSVTEESQLQFSGTLSVTDVDTGEAHFSNTDVVGSLGTLHLQNNGAWTYDLDNTNPKVQALAQGTTATDTITVHSADGTPHQVTITVNGTNDTAVIAGTDFGSVTEESQLQSSGTLSVTDVDTGEAHFSNSDVVGVLGTLHLKEDGNWTYDLDNTNPKVQALGQGATATDTITVHSADGTPHQVTITVKGTNDTAAIAGTDSGSVTEESQLQASGKLTVIDVDTGESHFSNTNVIGSLGTLHLQDNGAWTYDLDNTNPKVQALSQGVIATDTMTVHSADGTPHQVTITINGTNDTAVIAGTDSGSVTEESQLQASGTLTVTDVDTGESHFSNTDVVGLFGTLHLKEDGNWRYDLDNTNPKVQALAQGATATDTITVHSADGTPHQVTITVNGTNDTAVIAGTDFGSVTEESQLQFSGTLSVTDVDTGEAHFSNTDVVGTFGTLHLKDNGAWTYDLDNTNPKVQALAQGATATDTMTVHSADGTPHQVTITVNGTNDKAVITGTDSGSVTEESQLQTSGTLRVTDVDTGEAHFSNTDVVGTLGTLHLQDNGAWTYDLDNANPKVQALGQGATATDTITVTSVDGTTHKVTITINGTNDRPLVSGTSTGAVIEQGLNTAGTPNATGSLTATDLDTSDTVTWAVNQPQGQFGTLSIDQQGHWHYQLDNSTGSATDKLSAGEHQSESFWITATDSAGATVPHKIVIDVQGSNDKPIVSAWTQLPAGKEDQPVTIKASDLLTHATDVDSSDILQVTNLQATHGSLTDNKDGTYTFTPDKDFNGEIRLTYDVIDGHGGSVSTQAKFDLTAAPDNAQISYAATDNHQGGVTEDHYYIDTHDNLHFNGKLDIVDPDKGEAQFDINLGPQTYQGIGYDTKLGGHVLIMQDGRYTYTIRDHQPLVQNLKQGETITDECVVKSQDGTPFTIKVSIHGTNDDPTLTAQHHSVNEDDSLLSGQMVGQDVDHGASLTYSIGNSVDGLTFNADGSYSFDPSHASYQSLAQGQTQTLTVPVTVTDEHGASATQNLEIVVTGTNDAAKVACVDTGDVHENQAGQNMSPDYAQPGMSKISHDALTTSGQLSIVDPDTNEAAFDSKGGVYSYHGQYGHLLLRGDGHWEYAVAAGQTDWQQKGASATVGSTIDKLGTGETLTDTITIQTKDGTTHDIVVTIHGDNDAPYVSGDIQLNSGKEDLPQTLTQTELLANSIDVDHNDLGKLSIANLHADHGSILDNKDGTYTFTPDKDYNGQVHFTYDVKDAHGGTSHAGANTTLVATPDKAIISEVSTGSVIEDGPHATHNNGTITELASGQLQVIDPDSGEDKFQYSQFGETKIHDPFGGMLRIDSAGNWGYSLDNAALQHLAQGQVETVTYRVHSFDGTAYDLNIDVVGTNDAPTVTKVVLSNGTEDTNYQMQASQFGFTDVDTGDTLHSIAITDLPPVAQGKFVLDGHDILAGQSITAADIAKLQFVSTPDFNGDVQFKFTVNDGHVDSQETTNTLHIDAVKDAAQISGVDTGDVDEGQGSYGDMSPDYAQPGMAKLGQAALTADGKLNIVDPDSGEAQFDTKGGAWNNSYHGQYGHLLLNTDGTWHYHVTVGSVDWVGNRKSTVGTTIDQLGEGQTLTDTITIQSKDGTTHDIVITIHGDNDRPYCSSEVQLNSGKEDLAQTITTTELLANTVDVDANDAGKLSIANLHVDHGSILDNKDGTYTFTPDKDYNGQVHFTYDVKDAHGGLTHTGANTTLAAVNDAATISGQDTGALTEDLHVQGDAQHTIFTTGVLNVIDPDAGEDHFSATRNAHALHDPYGGTLTIGKVGDWSYSVPNGNVQHLGQGESEQVQYEVQSAGGDKHIITLTIHGTNDDPVLSVTQTTPTTGTFTETDVDTNDTHTFSVVSSTGQFGSLSVDPDSGAYVYTANGSVAGMSYNSATQTYHGIDVFEVKVVDNHGGESTRFMTFDTNGQVSVIPGQQPTVSTSVPVNPLITATQPSLPAGTNTPPSNAVTVDLATPSDTGVSNTDNLTKDNTPTITGQTDIPYSQVTIYEGSKSVGHTVSDGSGHYSAAVSSLADGNHNLSALALAPAAAVPVTSSPLSVHVDTTISPLQIALTQDTGSNTSDLTTSDGSLTITGQEAGALIEYSTDNGHTWTSSFTPQQGSNTVSVRQTDVAGNVSTSSSLTFTLDNSSPAPTVKLATDSGNSSSDNITNVGDLSIGGIEQGATVEYSVDHGGHWSTQFTPVEGVNTVQVRQTDVAGNVSPSTSLTYRLDTSASASGDTNTAVEDTATQLSGNVLANDLDAQSVISTGDIQGQYGLFHLNSDGSYTYTLNNNLASVQQLSSGSKPLVDTIGYTAQDAAGNQASAHLSISIQGTDEPQLPPTTLVKPAQITGGAGHQDLHASLGIPPQHHTGTTQHHGWGILTSGGSVVTSLHGQFGTLHVDPNTGHLDYDYSTSSGVIKTHTGGSYGSGTDETDSFILTLDGSRDSQVAVHLHLHSQSIHGHSGHHIDMTTLTGIDVSPLSPPPPPPVLSQSDEVADVDTLDVDITLSANTEDDQHYVSQYTSHQASRADSSDSSHGAAAYLSALGIEATQTTHDTSAHAALPDDIDIVFADTQESVDNSPLAPDGTEGSVHEDEHQNDKHEDLINPDEHHDQGDPSSFIDPY
ncbi:VCBS domain-containing protein, partial [Vibrio astriarenae]|uniref:VCBS domain-containing protein n=1 Tax=Vibrio astriarenae TaxID=1481923 RepID=UPI003735A711